MLKKRKTKKQYLKNNKKSKVGAIYILYKIIETISTGKGIDL